MACCCLVDVDDDGDDMSATFSSPYFLQCFDVVDWATGRAPSP